LGKEGEAINKPLTMAQGGGKPTFVVPKGVKKKASNQLLFTSYWLTLSVKEDDFQNKKT
jgi:hypothetical protein